MSQSVILHVGLHKTATSSIQKTLADNRELLAAQNLHYGAFTNFRGQEHHNHSLPFYVGFAEHYQTYAYLVRHQLDPQTERDRLLVELDNALKLPGPAIFSGEEMSNLTVRELAGLRDYLTARGRNIRVIFYVRSPYAMTCSEGQEWLKTGRPYRVAHRKSMPAVERIQSVFPAAEVYSFRQAAAYPTGPVGFFLDLIGAETSELSVSTANEGLSDQVARMIAHINQVSPLLVEGKPNPLREVFDTRAFWRIKGDRYQLLASEFAEIEHSIEQENTQMRDILGSDYCDQEIEVRQSAPEWSISAIDHLCAALAKTNPVVSVLAVSHFFAAGLADAQKRSRLLGCLGDIADDQTRVILRAALHRITAKRSRRDPGVAERITAFMDLAL